MTPSNTNASDDRDGNDLEQGEMVKALQATARDLQDKLGEADRRLHALLNENETLRTTIVGQAQAIVAYQGLTGRAVP